MCYLTKQEPQHSTYARVLTHLCAGPPAVHTLLPGEPQALHRARVLSPLVALPRTVAREQIGAIHVC